MDKILSVSHQQSEIDWKIVKDDINLAFIRVQYGRHNEDNFHKKHEASCKKQKIPFGEFAYGLFSSVENAVEEAKEFIKRIDKRTSCLMLEIGEDTISMNGTNNLIEACQAFIDYCQNSGYKTGFCCHSSLYKTLGLNKIKADFLMIDQPDDNAKSPDYKCDIWKYTRKARIKGYNGNVEFSQVHGKKSAFWSIDSNKK